MFEEYLTGYFESAPYIISFAAGILSFLAPCVLPMVPAYISYISSLSINKLKTAEKLTQTEHIHLIIAAFLFVLGFSVVFIAFGALSDLVIYTIFAHPTARIIGGLIIIFFGLFYMRLININFLNFHKQAHFATPIKALAPFVLGLSFAVGWTPCVGPILGSIIMLSAQESVQGTMLMASYAFGLGVPFLLLAFFTSYMFNVINRFKKHFRLIEIVSGVLLIAIGGSILYDGIGLVSL